MTSTDEEFAQPDAEGRATPPAVPLDVPHPFDNDFDAAAPCRCGKPLPDHATASIEWVSRQSWDGPAVRLEPGNRETTR